MSASDTPRHAGSGGPVVAREQRRPAQGPGRDDAPTQPQNRTETASRSGEPTVPVPAGTRADRPGEHSAAAAAASTAAGAPAGRRTRKARLVLARVDPWSVMKLSFLLSIALAVLMVVTVAVLWTVLDNMGVFDATSRTVADITAGEDGTGFDLMAYAGLSRVMGVTTMLACINTLLITALATLGAFLYNIATSLVGGLHVTLTEEV